MVTWLDIQNERAKENIRRFDERDELIRRDAPRFQRQCTIEAVNEMRLANIDVSNVLRFKK